jgi:hypothetical protein
VVSVTTGHVGLHADNGDVRAAKRCASGAWDANCDAAMEIRSSVARGFDSQLMARHSLGLREWHWPVYFTMSIFRGKKWRHTLRRQNEFLSKIASSYNKKDRRLLEIPCEAKVRSVDMEE